MRHVVGKVAEALNDASKPIRGSRILVLGVAYRSDVGDICESPALTILQLLHSRGADLRYADPYVPQLRTGGVHLMATELTEEALAQADLVLVVTNHRCVDWDLVAHTSQLIVDTRNALAGRAVSGTLPKL